MSDWPHQITAHAALVEAVNHRQHTVLCSPTGGGKTRIIENVMRWCVDNHKCAVLLTNRIMLFEQTSRYLIQNGLTIGLRPSGRVSGTLANAHIAMTGAECGRMVDGRPAIEADVVLIDEAHLHRSGEQLQLLDGFKNLGAIVIGFTATPVGLSGIYDQLETHGTVRELIKLGALLPAKTIVPNEPDCGKVATTTKVDTGDGDTFIKPSVIVGSVYGTWRKFNPDQRPALLFASGVPESLFFANYFHTRGVPCAHIDSEDIWLNGKSYDPSPQLREDLREMSRDGTIKLVCNRFVLREGINWPHLYHGIAACRFASVSGYVQSGGRLLRNDDTLGDHVLWQDHGGNYWLHQSLNDNRAWHLGLSDAQHGATVRRQIQDGERDQLTPCPNCDCASYRYGRECPHCGEKITKRVRRVIQADGTLRETGSNPNPPRYRAPKPNDQDLWRNYYFRGRNSRNGMTFAQLDGLFVYEQKRWPPTDLPLMPRDQWTWCRRVRDVPIEELR